MNIKQLFPSKWLCADDLNGRRFELTVTSAELVTVRNPNTNTDEQKLAVAFEKASKKLLLNKTQAFAIAEVADSLDTDHWLGVKIAVWSGRAKNGKPTIVIGRAAVQAPAPHLDGGDTDEPKY